jgi:hypothetical protein
METKNKKISTTTKLIIGAAVGGAAYLIYANWDKIKEMLGMGEKDAEKVPEKTTEETKEQKGSGGGTTTQVDPYKQKVEKLQGLLKIRIDGDAGKQTNGNLEYWWSDYPKSLDVDKMKAEGYPELKKNGKGVVTPSNIDYYINTYVAKKTPRMLMWTKQRADKTAQGRINFMKKLYSLGATGSKVQPKDNSVAKNIPTYKFDASRNSYVKDGGKDSISQGSHLFSYWIIAGYDTKDGWVWLQKKSNSSVFVTINPYTLEAV